MTARKKLATGKRKNSWLCKTQAFAKRLGKAADAAEEKHQNIRRSQRSAEKQDTLRDAGRSLQISKTN